MWTHVIRIGGLRRRTTGRPLTHVIRIGVCAAERPSDNAGPHPTIAGRPDASSPVRPQQRVSTSERGHVLTRPLPNSPRAPGQPPARGVDRPDDERPPGRHILDGHLWAKEALRATVAEAAIAREFCKRARMSTDGDLRSRERRLSVNGGHRVESLFRQIRAAGNDGFRKMPVSARKRWSC